VEDISSIFTLLPHGASRLLPSEACCHNQHSEEYFHYQPYTVTNLFVRDQAIKLDGEHSVAIVPSIGDNHTKAF